MRRIYDKIVAVLSGIPVDKYIHCIIMMVLFFCVYAHTSIRAVAPLYHISCIGGYYRNLQGTV